MKRIAAPLDQFVCSLGNFILLVVAGREFSALEFGSIAVVLTIYQLGIGAIQASVSDVMLFVYPRIVVPRDRHSSGGLWLGAAGGIAAALLMVVAGVVIFPSHALLALAAIFPFLALQDTVRHLCLATRQPIRALLNDALWTVLALAGLFALVTSTTSFSPATAILVWGLPGALASLVGLLQLRTMPKRAEAGPYCKLIKPHVLDMLGEFTIASLAGSLIVFLIAAISGLRATAALRAATAVFSPLNSVVNSLRVALIPQLSRRLALGRPIGRLASLIGIIMMSASLAIAAALRWLPGDIGGRLFGDSWSAAKPLVLFAGLQSAAYLLAIGYVLGLRALGATDVSFRIRMISTTLTSGAGIAGAARDGAKGALLGLTLGGFIAAVLYLRGFRRAEKDFEPARLGTRRGFDRQERLRDDTKRRRRPMELQ